MKTSQIEKIIRKVEELKALFIFGQRVMPFLEDLFYFIQEIVPLLDEINTQLKESSKRMPKASSQLNKVTEATEMATQEILDMVDGIVFKVNGIQTNINRFKSYSDLQDDLSKRIQKRLTLLEQKYPDDQDIKGMKELWEKVDQSGNIPDPLESSKTYINEIRMLASNIMISSQVQDITAQQIASVNHLISSVQEKLSEVLTKLDTENLPELTDVPKIPIKKVAFDPNAVYTKAGERQHIVEDILSGKDVDMFAEASKELADKQKQEESQEQLSTDDIEKLLNSTPSAPPKSPAPAAPASDSGFDVASQDDINALFK